MSRKNGGFRKKSVTGFVQPTVEEINTEIRRKVDYAIAEKLEKIRGLRMNYCDLKIVESHISFRLDQLGLNEKGEKIKDMRIVELFNGAPKPEIILKAELDKEIDVYKLLVGEIEGATRYLKQNGFSDEDVVSIKLGVFDSVKWHESQSLKEHKGLGVADYVG